MVNIPSLVNRKGLICFAAAIVTAIALGLIFLGTAWAVEHEIPDVLPGAGLSDGKNIVNFTFGRDMLVGELVSNNPEIEAVSYYDGEQERTVGYVNVFGGVGSNFFLEANKTYEIIVSENVTLQI